jgi:hypothetical protein
MLIFPASFYFLAGYSESLFLALVLLCIRQARKGNLLLAGILAIFATLTRQVGVLLSIPIFIEGLRSTGFSIKQFSWHKLISPVIYALLPVAGFAFFSLYVHFNLGYGFVWNSIDSYGKRGLVFPGWGIIIAVNDIIKGNTTLNPFSMGIDALVCLTACIVFIQGIRHRKQIPFSFLVYFLANLLVIIMYVIDEKPLVSATRYLLAVFPIFIFQAQLWKVKWQRMAWLAFSTICNIFMFVGFYAWFWVE